MTISATEREAPRIELTIRGVILGILITFVFTAANVYLGLKVGLTFASSIPAAVISMAVLRVLFKNSTIWENNIVQTVASAAGTLSSIIFVLPGLVMIGWWTGFPFWLSFGVCVVGGVLGVMYTIPLRRALVTASDLPYPEGVAAAEVLKVGAGTKADAAETGGDAGLLTIVVGSVASAAFAAIVAAKIFAAEVSGFFRPTAGSATGLVGSLSLALVGAGHLMGVAVGVAMLVGLIITWGVATPIVSALHPIAGPAADVATQIWKTKVRFIGAGAIGAAAIWTLGRLAAPIWGGVMSAIHATVKSSRGEYEDLPRTERDLPIWIVGVVCVISIMPMTGLLQAFLAHSALEPLSLQLTVGAVAYIVVAGFLVAAVCGYMAGLIGSSNSPVSGLAILAVLGAALLLLALAPKVDAAGQNALVAFALFVTSMLITVATIANDNLQDLKTGQLVDATPWRQQVGLVIGVFAGAVVIPPILTLLDRAYGFAGEPHIHAIANQPLPAPQATLISALAKGVIQGQLDWGLIGIGVLLGIGLIAADELLRLTKRYSLPPLGVSMAIYLPSAVTTPIVIGAFAGWIYDRVVGKKRHGGAAKRMGILMASGLIVGESLFNVALAGLIVATNKGEPLALVAESFAPMSIVLGLIGSLVVIVALYIFSAIAGQRSGAVDVEDVAG
jgi:putative OPT family oligopeptide transporter